MIISQHQVQYQSNIQCLILPASLTSYISQESFQLSTDYYSRVSLLCSNAFRLIPFAYISNCTLTQHLTVYLSSTYHCLPVYPAAPSNISFNCFPHYTHVEPLCVSLSSNNHGLQLCTIAVSKIAPSQSIWLSLCLLNLYPWGGTLNVHQGCLQPG